MIKNSRDYLRFKVSTKPARDHLSCTLSLDVSVNTRHLVDENLLPFLDALPAFQFNEETLPLIRANAFPLPPASDEAVAAIRVESRHVPGPIGAPDVGLMLYRPCRSTDPIGCILHIHGGGYVAGSAAALEPLHRQLSHELGCAIVSVEYRLAPEAHYPCAIEDCYAALNWLAETAEALGIDPTRIGVMGESAGGGLAAALALMARDRDGPGLAFQHLIYPMLDDRTSTSEPHPHAGEFIWTAESNAFGWRSLLGTEPGGPDVPPYASAARAVDLAKLPPTYIATGALDLFGDENLEYARRLMRAGVPTELHVYPGAYHGFDVFGEAPISRRARGDSIAALTKGLQ